MSCVYIIISFFSTHFQVKMSVWRECDACHGHRQHVTCRTPSGVMACWFEKNRSHSVRGCLSGNPDTDCRWLSRPIRLRVRPQGVQPSLEFRMDSNALAFAPARHLIHGFHYRSRSHDVAFLPVKENAPRVFPTRRLLMFSEPHSIALPAPSGAFRKVGCGPCTHACAVRRTIVSIRFTRSRLPVFA